MATPDANDTNEIFAKYPTASWKPDTGSEIKFAVQSIKQRGGNRLVQHKRLYRKGARLDDTGAQAVEWELACFFFNDPEQQEDGLDGVAQYPDNANAMVDSFDVHETGTLTTPTRGPRRCRAATYERVEQHDARDACAMTLVFIEDNEDDASAAAFTAPSAKTVNVSVAAAAVEACAAAGAWDDNLGGFNDFISDLQGLAEFPGNYVSDFESKAKAAVNKLAATEEAFTSAATDAVDEQKTLLTQPENSRALRLLRQSQDANAAIAEQVLATAKPVIKTVTFTTERDIFDIAAQYDQDPGELSKLNNQLPDLTFIAAGTPVKIYDASA